MAQDIVKLNVGGIYYTTTKDTLTRFPESMLGAMFSGSFTASKDENGYYFIDRNGKLFEYVLDFLRSSILALPGDFQLFDQLCIEADFYQIEPLIQELASFKRNMISHSLTRGHTVEIVEIRTGPNQSMFRNGFLNTSSTLISGHRHVLDSLPFQFDKEIDSQHENDFVERECQKRQGITRLKIGEYLHNSGWKLMNSNVTSSSTQLSSKRSGQILIEHTYRDRWLSPMPTKDTISEPEGCID